MQIGLVQISPAKFISKALDEWLQLGVTRRPSANMNGKRSAGIRGHAPVLAGDLNANQGALESHAGAVPIDVGVSCGEPLDRKSTRLNSSHVSISYAVFCLKKKKQKH